MICEAFSFIVFLVEILCSFIGFFFPDVLYDFEYIYFQILKQSNRSTCFVCMQRPGKVAMDCSYDSLLVYFFCA